MHLSELINESGAQALREDFVSPDVGGLTCDSRDVRAGWLFAAFPGLKVDGRDFIADAVARGAVAVLVPVGTEVAEDVIVIKAENPRRAFAKMAATFHGRQVATIIAVTGTNGKSSTVNFCRQMWQAMDHAAASLGTLGIEAPGIQRAGLLTTPDPVTLHSEVTELEAAGVTHLALEASSQGLDQYRLDGLHVGVAGFSNLTRDHLDYHGSMEKYFDAKARLFRDILVDDGIAVINADDKTAKDLRELCVKRNIRVIDYGETATDIRLVQRKPLQDGQFIEIQVMGERYELELPLVGGFQVWNALLALGLVIAADPDNKMLHMQSIYTLERLQPVRGRLELAGKHPQGGAIYVDYAHAPGGLEEMLKALRPHTPKKLNVVFGCGGDRDKGKRPMMGEISQRLADVVIVTDDNPRTEDAAVIRKEVMTGCPNATEIAGREKAIRVAIEGMGPGDVLVVAGKGHEQGQIIGKEILPFDDVSVVKSAVMELIK